MANKNVLTLKDILNRKEYFKGKNKETRELYIKRLDANIVISKPDVELCSDIADMDNNHDTNKYFMYEIVVEPNLKDSKLHEEFGVADPVDIIDEIFDPGEVNRICTEGMKFAGFYDGVEVVEDLKKLIKSDMELYMYSYYLNKGIDLDKLINLSFIEKQFYIASICVNKEEEVNKFNL